jgi:hypothetical protein
MLLNTLNLETKALGKRHQRIEVTLAIATKAVVIANNHTAHTKPTVEHIANKLCVGLTTKLLVEVCNDHIVDAGTLEQKGTLLNRGKQLQTLVTPHSYAGVWVEANDNANATNALCHSLQALQQHTMSRVHTIERAYGNNCGAVGGQLIEAIS